MLTVILQQGINGIVVGSLYVLVALGLTLIYGVLVLNAPRIFATAWASLTAQVGHALSDLSQGNWLLAICVGLLSPLSYILVLTAIDMGAPLSLVAPAREMSMMVAAMFGMVLLGEPVNAWRIAGCLALVVGVVLLGAA